MQHGLWWLWVYGQRANMAQEVHDNDDNTMQMQKSYQAKPTSVVKWAAQMVGTCEQADFGGDCDSGTLGAWKMRRGTLESCVSRCEACARCRFVSFSRVNSDVRAAVPDPPLTHKKATLRTVLCAASHSARGSHSAIRTRSRRCHRSNPLMARPTEQCR